MFARRAQAVQPDFQLTIENTDAVLEICRRLDGLPLAIELAAARVKILTPQAMLSQFDRRLDWLARGARDSQTWHQTLRSAIDWSYNLLSDSERMLMRRLSVFSGGWTSESAEAVCADADSPDSGALLRRVEIFDLLIQLSDKSLIIAEPRETETRYRFLETIREFAHEKLEQAGELTEIQNRHLAYYCAFAQEAEVRLESADQILWANLCEAEHNNIRAALEWSLKDSANHDNGLRLAASISLFWIFHSHFIEGLERINVFLPGINDIPDKSLRAKLLYRSARLLYWRSEYHRALELCNQSVALCKEMNDPPQLAVALYYQGEVLVYLNDLAAARIALEESVAICWQVHAPAQLNTSLASLGSVLHKQGDHAAAHAMLEESLGIATRISDHWSIVNASQIRGYMFRLEGKFAEAQIHFERCKEVAHMMGDRINLGIALSNLSNMTNMQEDYAGSGRYAAQSLRIFRAVGDELELPFPMRMMAYAALHAGDTPRARVLIRESLTGNRRLEHIPGQLACVVAFAKCSLAEKDAKKAVSLCALIETRMKADGVKLMEPDVKALQEALTQGKKKLGRSAYESAYAEGKSLQLEDEIMKLLRMIE
ncbi:MAG: tetratricopeptide repeat protein [Anaerolineae bacterium]|nr:tetratricopeptide repeat protein [Anaerolineae bacterium]